MSSTEELAQELLIQVAVGVAGLLHALAAEDDKMDLLEGLHVQSQMIMKFANQLSDSIIAGKTS